MMHKQEKIDLIVKVYVEKVKPSMVAAELGDFEIRPSLEMPHGKLDATITWLHDYIGKEVSEFNKVWVLCTPEVWKNYKLFKLTDLIEMKMLKIVKANLRDTWTKRPSAIRRSYGTQEV
jgi:hypothetical protein